MVFWNRISRSQLKQLSVHVERCCLQASRGSSRHYTATISSTAARDGPSNFLYRRDNLGFCSTVRFFAAPVQAKPKKEEKEPSGVRLNEQINAREVRVVTDEGHFIVPFYQALNEAKRLNLDLVEVQRDANLPVVKIMDYNMVRFKQKQVMKERAKLKGKSAVKAGAAKEVRFTVKTEAKDLAIKADQIKRLVDRGYRVKCMAVGTEDQDLGSLLARMIPLIEDVCLVESGPQVEKKQAFVVVRHMKFEKKAGGKKKVDVYAEIKRQQLAIAQAAETGDSVPKVKRHHEPVIEEPEEDIPFSEDEKPIKFQFDPSTKVRDLHSTSNRGSASDFQRPAQVQADRAPAQPVVENRYARKTDQGRRFPPHNLVDNNNQSWGLREPYSRNTPRQDRPYPNFSRNSSVPPGEMQRPGQHRPDPRDTGPSFRRIRDEVQEN